MSMSKKSDPKFRRSYARAMLRSAFVSLFWAIISERKKQGEFTLQGLAKKIGSSKHELSRWFNGDPNWTLNTVASIAEALEVELRIEAVDRAGQVFKPFGLVPKVTSASAGTETAHAVQSVKVTRVLNSSETKPLTSAVAA